jgi:hypothetical protein
MRRSAPRELPATRPSVDADDQWFEAAATATDAFDDDATIQSVSSGGLVGR